MKAILLASTLIAASAITWEAAADCGSSGGAQPEPAPFQTVDGCTGYGCARPELEPIIQTT